MTSSCTGVIETSALGARVSFRESARTSGSSIPACDQSLKPANFSRMRLLNLSIAVVHLVAAQPATARRQC